MKSESNPTVPLLDIRDLSVFFGPVPAVKGVSFTLNRGETLALVGESGSGKSVSALSILQLLPYPHARHPSGSICLRGEELLGAAPDRLREVRGNQIAMVFQEPMTSLNPLHSIEKQVGETLSLHKGLSGAQRRTRILELLELVGLPDAAYRLNALPHELSGGQRQRVMIAMALANEPDILIADEPTTALDVTIQAQILKLLKELQAKLGMAILFITHDLGIVAQMADRVAIMYSGRIVESGPVRDIFRRPVHPYTRALLDAVPRLGDIDRHRKIRPIAGSIPNIFDVPGGCRFHPRCPVAQLPRCAEGAPPRFSSGRHHVSCIHGAEELGR